MCHPGLPFPQGEGQKGSPALLAFHRAKSAPGNGRVWRGTRGGQEHTILLLRAPFRSRRLPGSAPRGKLAGVSMGEMRGRSTRTEGYLGVVVRLGKGGSVKVYRARLASDRIERLVPN